MSRMNASEYWKSGEINIKRVQELSTKFAELKIVDKEINVSDIIQHK